MSKVAVDRTSQKQSALGRCAAMFVYLFEAIMPDPFIFAVTLTFLGAILACVLVPGTTAMSVAIAWYDGVFNIFTFAFQMVMMLVAGYALATSPLIQKGLGKLASLASTPASAISLTVAVSMIASWLNWGLGLVVAALLAREVAKCVRLDFGWLVAAAYTGFVVSTEGLSGSIALSQATHGSALNIVEKITGKTLPLFDTVLMPFTLMPVVSLLVVLPILFRYLQPTEEDTVVADPDRLRAEDQDKHASEKDNSLSSKLDRAWIFNLALVAFGGFALAMQWARKGISIELNSVILILLMAGLLLHWRPSAYISAIKNAARVSGSLILQYPLYGGLMGIITTTGLAAVLSKVFIRISTAHTLPFYTYLTSLIITLFVPSGGGHWAVQGPLAIPAARDLHASMAGTTMAVAMGESVANMLQPFWALPVLAIAGIKMRRMMGFMVITFVVSFLAFGLALLFLIPSSQ